ncbi:MAG: hypothetical protein WCT08_02025 [Patescibacteria group bacterium]|jgi:hypothetical protein
MILFLRLLPTLIIPYLGLIYYFTTKFYNLFWIFIVLALIGPLLALWLITKKINIPQGFMTFIFFPIFAILTSFGALMFSEALLFKVIICLGMVLLTNLYLENTFRFVFQPARYQTNALLNLSLIFAVFGLLFALKTIFDFSLFVNLAIWLTGIIFIVMIFVWLYFLSRLLQAPKKINKVFSFGLVVFGVQLFLLASWFPILPIYKAGFLVVFLTLAVQIYRNELLEKPQASRWTLIIYTLVLIFLLATAKWFI